MRISLIAARSENNMIGKNNDLPWKVKGDWAFFKKTSMGKPVIMGRKTFESIKHPFPGRTNIIVTRNTDFTVKGAIVVNTLEDAIKKAKEVASDTDSDEIMIAGGSEIYKIAMPFCNRMYLNEIHCTVDGDTNFPDFSLNEWKETFRERHGAEEGDTADYSIVIFDRI